MSETPATTTPADPPLHAPGDVPVLEDAEKASPGRKKRGRHEAAEKKGFWSAARELPILVVMALVLALLIKTFLVQAFFIPSPSMVPTLEVGDRVLVSKISTLSEPNRGDVIVFLNPNRAAEPPRNVLGGALHWLGQGLGLSQSPDEDFIKRVIGLPGETVKVTADGVLIDGEKLEEPYIAENGGPTGVWQVPEDHVFVMGDNRANSSDSRVFKAIPIDSIVGRAFVRMWPFSRVGWL